jgi:hypothetical protein
MGFLEGSTLMLRKAKQVAKGEGTEIVPVRRMINNGWLMTSNCLPIYSTPSPKRGVEPSLHTQLVCIHVD